MPLWGLTDNANNAPKYRIVATANALGNTMYQNVTPSSFLTNTAAGVFGVNANGVHQRNVAHRGWVVAKQYLGPIATVTITGAGTGFANLALGGISNGSSNATFVITTNSTGAALTATVVGGGGGFINATQVSLIQPANGVATFSIGGGSGYANGDLVRVSNGGVNATGQITTNATGGITSIALVAPGYGGRGFSNTLNSTVAITNSIGGATTGTNGNVAVATLGAGSGLTVTVALGGRGGRIEYETLVAGHVNVTANSSLFNA